MCDLILNPYLSLLSPNPANPKGQNNKNPNCMNIGHAQNTAQICIYKRFLSRKYFLD